MIELTFGTTLLFAVPLLAYYAGRCDGRRLYQIDLRVAHHQGKNIVEMVENND